MASCPIPENHLFILFCRKSRSIFSSISLGSSRESYKSKALFWFVWAMSIFFEVIRCEDMNVEIIYLFNRYAKISGATIVASDSMTNFGVSIPNLPQVIFSLGIAPE